MKKLSSIIFSLLFACSVICNAQQSTWLDPTFGNSGIVITDMSTNSINDNYYDLILQPDGKIISIGWFHTGDTLNYSDAALIRYHSDGSVDSSFGINGKAIYNIAQQSSQFDRLLSGALQSDGKIVCTGSVSGSTSLISFVIRFTQNGEVDSSFGINGLTMIDLDTIQSDEGNSMVIQADDKIVIAGSKPIMNHTIFRLNSDGIIDSTFGSNGFVSIGQAAQELTIQGDGKILAAGLFYPPGAPWYSFGVVRLDTLGQFDNTFGINGRSHFNFQNLFSGTFKTQRVSTVDVDQNGKIVISGSCNCSTTTFCDSSVFAVARLDQNGNLDSTFGISGRTFIVFDSFRGYATEVVIQPSGKMFIIGQINFNDYGIAMLTSNGTLDSTFNFTGKLEMDSLGDNTYANSAFLQPDGKLVIGGSVFLNLQKYYFCTVRLVSTLGLDIPENQSYMENIHIYPNPFSNILNFEFSSYKSEDIKIRMLDLMGREIISFSQINVRIAGRHQYELTIPSSLSSGLYLLTATLKKESKSFKLYKN